ncbi:MAG: hypothetical protein R3B13_14525 [Polyangiaceae bacterium]
MTRERQLDKARRTILARRARFVAAALAGSGIAVSAHLAAKPDDEADASSARKGCGDERSHCSPQICLSDIDIEGELVDPDAGAAAGMSDTGTSDAGAEEVALNGPLDAGVPHICLSIAPPSHDLPYHHDGFYLRLSLSPSLLTGVRDSDDASYTGLGLGGAVGVGMTLLPGTVLGLSLQLAHAPEGTTSAPFGVTQFDFGPMLDVYPSDGGGLHFGAMIGGTVVTLSGAGSSEGYGGPGGSLWFGYDAWVGETWSLGIGVRGNLAWLRRPEDKLFARNLSLSLSALWH